LAEYSASAGNVLISEDDPEILDSEQPEKDHGEELQGMYASGCDSINQGRLTPEQAEELGRRAKAPSRIREVRGLVTVSGVHSR
jgi:hypothetical protein